MSNETNYAPDPKPIPPVLLPSGRRGSSFTFRSVSVTNVAQRIVNFDSTRMTTIITAAGVVFLDRSPGVSAASKFQTASALYYQIDGFEEIWAIAATPVLISILEIRF
jgi:hypothetical protein